MVGFNSRVNTMLRTSGGTWYDPDTGEVMKPRGHQTQNKMSYQNFKPRSSKSYGSSVNFPKMPNFDVSKVLNLMLIGAVGLVGYNLYNKFFGGSVIEQKNDAGVAALNKTFVSTDQAKANAIVATADSLKVKGLTTGTLHASLADTLHNWLDSTLVPHDEIVKAILGMDVQTFRLASVSYGTRTLSTYSKSLFHIFNTSVWGLSDMLSLKDDKLTGTLKEHLKIVLYADELTKIHSYYSVI